MRLGQEVQAVPRPAELSRPQDTGTGYRIEARNRTWPSTCRCRRQRI
nr:hypothetical protein [Cupriavidus gilardii]